MASASFSSTLRNTKVELLEPLGERFSPIAAFLAKNPSGGMHHICYEVEDILAARDSLVRRGEGARRRRSEDRRPWQARALPAPEGFLRDADRTGTGVTEGASLRCVGQDRESRYELSTDRPISGRSMRCPQPRFERPECRSFQSSPIYFIIWWLTLFLVLPIGLRTQAEENDVVPGSVESAPARFRALRVSLLTSVIAAVIHLRLVHPLGAPRLRFGRPPAVRAKFY